MRQPEGTEVAQSLLQIALGLPDGWSVQLESTGQLRLLPPKGSDLAYLQERGRFAEARLGVTSPAPALVDRASA